MRIHQYLSFFLVILATFGRTHATNKHVCIVGSGMGGASASYFLKEYAGFPLDISIFEERDRVGGRMAVVDLQGDTFEAGGSIIHPKNLHSVNFTKLLGLKQTTDTDEESFGIWDGKQFVFQTARAGDNIFSKAIVQIMNTLSTLWRYGTSLWRMQTYVSELLSKFMELYKEDRPAFDSVEGLLQSVDLFSSTQYTLEELLLNKGLSRIIIDELVTFIMRINYGQSVRISGMAGGVSLCGSGGDLWAVEGGNWQIPEGLIRYTNASLHLNQKVLTVTALEGKYEVGLSTGGSTICDAVVLATPLDETEIVFSPTVDIPNREMQHTHTTFIRGFLNVDYFGCTYDTIPELIGTKEDSNIPFSSINILKEYNATDKAYKMFSRVSPPDELLDQLFSIRSSTIRINWAAYPHYSAPEKFAPYILDGNHLYYINAFENAASTIETSAVSAQNVVRLFLSRISDGVIKTPIQKDDNQQSKVEDLEL